MTQFVVLFRGINVGGHNKLPMKGLVSLLEQNQFQDVASYIQSGNIVLKSDVFPLEKISQLITQHYGFTPEIFVLDETEFKTALANNPYSNEKGNCVHFYFTKDAINLNENKMTKWLAPSEAYYVHSNVFYLHAPDGIGRSKLVSNISSCLGQSGTGRNLNTINKINTML